MLSAEEITHWKEADRVLAPLLELDSAARAAAITAMPLSPDVRRCVEMLHQATLGDGPLDHELVPGLALAPAGSLTGERLGSWRLCNEIGRGGMAVVYRANREGSAFEQTVAIKLLPRGMRGHERFETEQQVLARLQHPNIARMLDGGVSADGTPWLAMDLVEGQTIDRYCRLRDTRTVIGLFQQVVDAVAYAHSLLVVHRDLKPGNILVDASGRVRLLDFGIAKLITTEMEPAATRILTSEYGAPEQLAGGEISTATDVFGLGAVLHALLTGRAPRNRDGSDTEVLATQPLDPDLKNIVRKALRDEPQLRYLTAQALGEDLQRWLSGLPVAATAGSRRYRAGKWFRRHRLGASVSGLALLAVIAAVTTVLWQAEETRRQLRISQATTEFLVQLFEEADPVVAQGRPTTARELLARAERTLATIEQPLIQDELTRAMARAYFGMGDFKQAHELLSRRLSTGLNTQPLATRLLYAQALHADGEAAAAIRFLDGLPEPERRSLSVRHLLGRYFSADGQYQRADAELAAAEIAVQDEASAADRLNVLTAIAMNHIGQARYEQALSVLLPAAELADQNDLWSERGVVAKLLGQVAEVQGRHADSLDHYVAASNTYQRVYSTEHSIMIELAMSEAQALRNLGRHEEALQRLEVASALAHRRLGDNALTVNVLNSLSMAEEQLGELAMAIQHGHQAASMMGRLGNSDHPLRANLLANIANYHISLGEFELAEQLTREAESILQKTLPQGHPVFIHTQFQLARIYSRRKETTAAKAIMQQLLPRALKSPGPGNHLTISIMRDLGRQHLRLKEWDDATSCFEQAAEAAIGFPADSLLRVYVELGLAEVYLHTGQIELAAALMAPHLASIGSSSRQPDGQTVYTEALLAFHRGDTAQAVQRVDQAEQLMAGEPDRGASYRPEIDALSEQLRH